MASLRYANPRVCGVALEVSDYYILFVCLQEFAVLHPDCNMALLQLQSLRIQKEIMLSTVATQATA